MITANTDELQVISSIEMPASDNSWDGGGKKGRRLIKRIHQWQPSIICLTIGFGKKLCSSTV